MITRGIIAGLSILLGWGVGIAGGPTPEEAAKRMVLPAGFTVRVAASEPTIRQPVSMSFDDRGRLWILQYLQYPNPAGLKALQQDQYLRTVWDKVLDPPPAGPKGLDRLTILYDPDEHGVYRKSKDFLTGLNLASGFCLGRGGVYVLQAPYLLFYPDQNGDDVPDGDPQVLLTGFGLDDTHSLANSLQWGPDGWLYGAAGSTSTCKIRNPARPAEPVVEFQQGVWRYHPPTKRFELFSEGGGNTYGLDFDATGQAIAGTNYGGYAMLHQRQGAYHVKGFSKHGPLHNPYSFGYFDHVPYTGFKGGHVTCGGIVYQAETFPPEYRDQYIAGNLLSNAIYWHKIERNGSTFKARHGGDLMTTTDNYFRPVDLMQGPDGSVYVADWTDPRAAHLDPVDNWDKTNGRVYKIEYQGTPNYPTFDLRKKSNDELIALLKHPNAWWQREARRILGERADPTTYPILQTLLTSEKGPFALQALWTLAVAGGFDDRIARQAFQHPNEHVREWAVRLVGDTGTATTDVAADLATLAEKDPSVIVRAQLASTAKRLAGPTGMRIALNLLRRDADRGDPFVPLLIWWALEPRTVIESDDLEAGLASLGWKGSIVREVILERVAQRDMSEGPQGVERAARLLTLASQAGATGPVIRGMEQALTGKTLTQVPAPLTRAIDTLRPGLTNDETFQRLLLRLGDPTARAEILTRVKEESTPEAQRLKWLGLLVQTGEPTSKTLIGPWLSETKSPTFRVGLLGLAGTQEDPALARAIVAGYSKWSAGEKRAAIGALLSRASWAKLLFEAAASGTIPKTDLSVDQARLAVGLNDPALTTMVEKQFGKLTSATPGEKRARIAWLNTMIGRVGPPDLAKGKVLFTKNCATCHVLHGEGGKVGPDLSTADRKNRDYMLQQIVDPSGYIRTEYVTHKVSTLDGRTLTGLVAESNAASITLVAVVDNKEQKTVIPRKEIDDLTPLPVSLMPEKLLDTMTYEEIGDLFAYLASDKSTPTRPKPVSTTRKGKLKVALISGSVEYKSDETLPILQKYLEENYPIECVRIFRKTDAELSDLDKLKDCDAAVFFTRRLTIDGPALESVKSFVNSGKPIIGIRTASHGFQKWLEMDKLVFGGDYKNHYGAGPDCDVKIAPAGKDHPVLKGVQPFRSPGSLYKNPAVSEDVTVLLTGSIPDHQEPIAWVRERKVGEARQRVFYTSLGHPDDFREANFLRLVANGIVWATRIPAP